MADEREPLEFTVVTDLDGTRRVVQVPASRDVHVVFADEMESYVRTLVSEAFMEGLKLGGRLPTLQEIREARDARAEAVVQRWRSAR